jgi:PAS domain S-box-containing protein
VRTTTLTWATGLFCALLGALMLVAPHQFVSSAYPALRANTVAWGAAFLASGVGLLAAGALAPPRPWSVAAHAAAGAVLLVLAQGFGAAGGIAGALVYGPLGLATAAAPLLRRDVAARAHAPSLLAVVLGASAVLLGVAALASPAQFGTPAYGDGRGLLPALGTALLVAGPALLFVQARRAPRAVVWAAHLGFGAVYMAFAALVAVPGRGTTGIVYYGGFGLLVAVLPWLAPRLARIDPRSLRTRLALALIAASTLPLLVAVSVGNDQAERARVAEALAEQAALASALARDVATHGSTYRAAMATVGSRLDTTWSPEQQRAALATLTLTDVTGFATYDADGRNVARGDALALSPLPRALAEELHRSGQPVQMLAVSPQLGRSLLVFAAPSRGPAGELRGFVAAEMDPARLATALARSRPTGGPGGLSVAVVAADGRAVSSTDGVPGADLSAHPAVDALGAAAAAGALSHPSLNGDQLAGYAPVPGLGWGVVVSRPVADVVAATRALRDLSFAFLLAVAALAAAAGSVAADRLVRPLSALARAADRLAAGDATAPLPRSEVGEVEALSARFGDMRDRLISRAADQQEMTDALMQSEARKDAILQAALDGILTVDDAGRVLDLNPAAEELFGYGREEATGQDLLDLVIPADRRDEVRAAWAQLTTAGEDLTGAVPIELTLVRRDGTAFPAEIAVSPIRLGGTRMVTAFVRDLTDRKEVEAERARRMAQEEVVRAKDELVSVVSHELRTPLVSLVGFTELMLVRDFAEAERREFLTIILEEGRRLTSLINDFLDLQRMESGGLRIAPEPMQLDRVVLRAVEAAGEDPERPILVDLPDDLPTVLADDDRVAQVLANLLSNARKYSPAGGPIELQVRAYERHVAVNVRDHGLGIPENALPQLFEKFYRVDNSDRREIGGTGLGLAICRQIVGAHGGRITAESAGLGKGSTFRFTLPIADAMPATADVLVVEDDAGFARLLETELAAVGLSTVRVASAEAALARLVEAPPRAVVLDLLLPGLQGEAFVRRMTGDDGRSPVPVVVVTVKELGVAQRSELERLGVVAVFQKGPGVAGQAARAVGGTLGVLAEAR